MNLTFHSKNPSQLRLLTPSYQMDLTDYILDFLRSNDFCFSLLVLLVLTDNKIQRAIYSLICIQIRHASNSHNIIRTHQLLQTSYKATSSDWPYCQKLIDHKGTIQK